jgi:hypothetical protein
MMKKGKIFIVVPLIAFLLTMAILGGQWSSTSASGTVPHPGEGTAVPGAGLCNSSSIDVSPVKKGTAGCLPWQAYIPLNSVCTEGIVVVYDHKIVGDNPPPYFWKMINYGDGFEVRFFVKGVLVKDPACGDYNVRYYMNSWQRSVFDKTPNEEGIYYLDPATNTWQNCKATLDKTLGVNGVLVCAIKTWGFYALGHPSIYNK